MTPKEHLPFLNRLIIIALMLPATTLAASIAFERICPVNQGHCECEYSFGSPFYSLRCSNISDYDDFAEIIGNLSETAAILEMSSLHMELFPLDTLHNRSMHTVIITNSSFSALSNASRESFNETSLENLHHLSLENVTMTDKWTWNQISLLDELQVFFSHNSTIGRKITKEFSQCVSKNLIALTISESNITEIEKDSFKEMNNMTNLRITHSKLRTISRDILPAQTKLEQLRLDFNKIHELPENIFENMTHLKVVSLSNNTISTLPEAIFKPLWRSDFHLELRGNPIKCDCRIKWITETQVKPENLIGQCVHPKRLYGKHIKDLTEKDLEC